MELLKYIKTNYYNIILHVVIVLLGIEVYMLSMKVKYLNEEYAGVTVQMKVGDMFSLSGLQGLNGSLLPDTTKEIAVFLFTTTCPFCKANVPKWNSLDSLAKIAKGVRAIGICIDTEPKMGIFIQTYNPTYPIFLPKDSRTFQKMNKIGSVPKTFIRDSVGRITLLYTSSLTKENIAEIANAISASTTNH